LLEPLSKLLRVLTQTKTNPKNPSDTATDA
jgi:hypothetical protein